MNREQAKETKGEEGSPRMDLWRRRGNKRFQPLMDTDAGKIKRGKIIGRIANLRLEIRRQ